MTRQSCSPRPTSHARCDCWPRTWRASPRLAASAALRHSPSQPRHGFLHDVQGFGITPLQRAETLLWLQELSDFHDCGDDVFACSADLLDQLLGCTKASTCRRCCQLTRAQMKHKYLRVAAVACLLIATKCLMEEEDQPLLADLVGSCRGEFTGTDLKRMEMVVLDKLQWRVPTASPLAVLHNMTVVVSAELQLAEDEARMLMDALDAQFVSCAVSYELLRFTPSTLAAALLALALPELTGLSEGLPCRVMCRVA